MTGQPFIRLLARCDPEHLEEAVRDFLDGQGAEYVRILVVDYGGTVLCPLTGSVPEPIDGWPAADAYHRQEMLLDTGSEGDQRVYAPISSRSERIGVLEVALTGADDTVVPLVQDCARDVALALESSMRFSDRIARIRRLEPMSIAAEMQWSLLPGGCLAHSAVSAAGRLVPAYHVGGDNFDYSVDGDWFTVSVTDAMGHARNAAVLAGLAVAALRSERRNGSDLETQVSTADRVVLEQFGGAQFVTTLVVQVELSTGRARVLNAGLPPMLLLRAGTVIELQLEPHLPLGLFEQTDYHASDLALEPGDRLVLFSDGLVEARDDRGVEYGEERLTSVVARTGDAAPHEVARALLDDMQRWAGGGSPHDDATVMCVDYLGTG